MKSKRMVKWIVLTVTAIAVGIGVLCLYQAQFITLDMSFASTIVVEYMGPEEISVTLTPEETEKLKSYFTGKMKKESLSKCGFNDFKIRFIGEGQEIVVFPGGDHCDNTALGINGQYDENGVFFSIGMEGNHYLWSLAMKYDLSQLQVADYLRSNCMY